MITTEELEARLAGQTYKESSETSCAGSSTIREYICRCYAEQNSDGSWNFFACGNVAHQFPLPQPFEDAVAAFIAARNAECIAMLYYHTSLEAAFLRTRALIRLRRLDDAENAIRSVQPRPDHPAELAQCHMLLATVLDRQGDYEGAMVAFDDARAYAYCIPSVALHAELAHYEALFAWRRHDFGLCEKIASSVFVQEAKPYDEPHPYPLEVAHAFLYELLALVEGVREQHQSQIDFLERGMQTLSQLSQADVWAEGSLLRNLANLVAELRIVKVADMMRTRAESLQWTPETTAWAYDVYRALGWNEALSGNYVGAFRDMRTAHTVASTIVWQMESILDRGYLFGQIGDRFAARERLDAADHLCRQIDWPRLDAERYVLLWAAEISAQLDAQRACALLAQYKAIRKPMDPALVASAHVRRWRAHERDAYGAVAAANGESSIALNHLRVALQTWDTLKFEWRAAKTANAIARITNSTEDIAGARRRAQPFAKSWLARTAGAASFPKNVHEA